MTDLFEQWIANGWNRLALPKKKSRQSGLLVGTAIHEGRPAYSVHIPQDKRAEHISIGGKTGQGKSFLIRNFLRQDIESRHGFLLVDFHGDLAPYVLSLAAQRERRLSQDVSTRLIVVDPGDSESSVGLNVLETHHANHFVQIAEFTQILKKRWQLESFGARTEELLRNSVHVLVDNHLTLVELSPLLTNASFRTACLQHVTNQEIADYFRLRFETASEAMQSVMREPILNKISAFTTDPALRHVLGQRQSSFSLIEAMDRGCWVVFHLNKGSLGENAVTLAALLAAKAKNALFSRRSKSLFSWYLDELQNLVAADTGLETVLSEARKFGISVVFANQFLAQLPPAMQAAALAIGTHVYFQLASSDADKVATALDSGKRLGTLLKNLPKRHVVLKSGSEPWLEVQVQTVPEIQADISDLSRRVRARWSTPRIQIEQDIRQRVATFPAQRPHANAAEDLHGWD